MTKSEDQKWPKKSHREIAIIVSVFYLLLALFYIYQYHSFVSFLEESYTKHIAALQDTAVKETHSYQLNSDRLKIALGGPISSRHITTKDSIAKMLPLAFLPNFCQTASTGVDYHFYLSFEADDVFFREDDNVSALKKHFDDICALHCHAGSRVILHVIQSKEPLAIHGASVALDEAYLDDMDYLCSIITLQVEHNWTSEYIQQLEKLNSPRMGVVGNGFVHRQFIDLLGSYSAVEKSVHNGSEYREISNRYIENKDIQRLDPTKVISISLNTTKEGDIKTAIRNAQLHSLIVPIWSLRFYVSWANKTSDASRIIHKLESLGAEVIPVQHSSIPSRLQSFLVLDDPKVEFAVILSPSQFLSVKISRDIDAWSKKTKTIVCLGQGHLRTSTLLVHTKGLRSMMKSRQPAELDNRPVQQMADAVWVMKQNASSLC